MMQVKVKLFAQASENVGQPEIQLEVPDGSTVATFRQILVERYPSLEPISSKLFVAVDAEYATDDQLIEPGHELACFPPVSGG